MSQTAIKFEISGEKLYVLIKTENNVLKKLPEFGTDSPLNGLSMTTFANNIGDITEKWSTPQILHDEAESLNQQARTYIGNMSQNSMTSDAISVRDVFAGSGQRPGTEISQMGFNLATRDIMRGKKRILPR